MRFFLIYFPDLRHWKRGVSYNPHITGKRHFIREFRFNSIFVKTFLLVLLMIDLLLGAFSVYTLQVENKALQKDAESSYLNTIETVGTITELTLQSLQQLMSQTIWDKTFVSAIITPMRNSYDRTSSVITTLRQITEENPYVKKAFLYIPSTDMVYSSNLSYLSTNQAADSLFDDTSALTHFSGTQLYKDAESLLILESQGRTFLCKHLYPRYLDTVGVLIFELTSELFDFSLGQSHDAEQKACYVYDADGSAIFSKEVPSEVSESIAPLLKRLPYSSSGQSGTLHSNSDSLYFYYRSPNTNWLYVYPAEVHNVYAPLSVQKILLVIALVSLVGLAFTFLIVSRTGRPIWSLMNELPAAGMDSIEALDEIDYLSKIYHRTTAQNLQLHAAIQSVTPLALERLFAEILSERAPTTEDLEAMLKSLGDPIPAGSRFLAINLLLFNKSEAELSAFERNLYALHLRSLLPEALPEAYTSYLIPREDNLIVVILVLPPSASLADVQSTVSGLYKQLQNLHMTTPYRLQLGCGNIYDRMKDVRYSYLDAQKALQRQSFYGAEGASESGNSPSLNPYFNEARQMFRYIQNKQPALAMELAQEITASIGKAHSGLSDLRDQYEDLVEAIIKIADGLHIGNIDELSASHQQLSRELRSAQDPMQMEQLVRRFCADAIGSAECRNRAKASQYVSRIREYIHASYSNSNLSLYMVAEQVGISPSYLSRLFKQEMQASFVDYVNSVRVEKSLELLRSSDLKIKDIAFQTGFNSMQNFFRIFKKLVGVTPGEYRQGQSGRSA